jgi:hypothetical protein
MNLVGLWTHVKKITAVLHAVAVFCAAVNVHPTYAVLDSVDHIHVSDSGNGAPDTDPPVHKAYGSHGFHEEHSHPFGLAVPSQDSIELSFKQTAWTWRDDPCHSSTIAALERPPRHLASL